MLIVFSPCLAAVRVSPCHSRQPSIISDASAAEGDRSSTPSDINSPRHRTHSLCNVRACLLGLQRLGEMGSGGSVGLLLPETALGLEWGALADLERCCPGVYPTPTAVQLQKFCLLPWGWRVLGYIRVDSMDSSPCAVGGQSWTGTEELAQSNRTGRAQILSNPACETPSCI